MKIKDGWHVLMGYDVYVENSRVLYGVTSDGQQTIYPFRSVRTGGWDNASGLTVDSFRAGIRRGTIRMF